MDWTFNVIDDFNREVLAIEIDKSLIANRAVRMLKETFRCEVSHEWIMVRNLVPASLNYGADRN
jgi:hypothetical protein